MRTCKDCTAEMTVLNGRYCLTCRLKRREAADTREARRKRKQRLMTPFKTDPDHRMTAEDREQIVRLYGQGKMTAEIARETGWSDSAVRRCANKLKIERPVQTTAPMTDELKAKILELYTNWTSIQGICDQLHMGWYRVSDVIKAGNFKRRSAVQYHKRRALKDYYNRGSVTKTGDTGLQVSEASEAPEAPKVIIKRATEKLVRTPGALTPLRSA
jgi:transposase-like protein